MTLNALNLMNLKASEGLQNAKTQVSAWGSRIVEYFYKAKDAICRLINRIYLLVQPYLAKLGEFAIQHQSTLMAVGIATGSALLIALVFSYLCKENSSSLGETLEV